MAADLAGTPVAGLRVQLCGDAHLSNFGLFASPERRLLFDLNDFDETLAGPFEWDVKRMAASFTIAARHNGFPKMDTRAATQASVRAYREAMASSRRWARWTSGCDLSGRARARGPVRRRAQVQKTAREARGREAVQNSPGRHIPATPAGVVQLGEVSTDGRASVSRRSWSGAGDGAPSAFGRGRERPPSHTGLPASLRMIGRQLLSGSSCRCASKVSGWAASAPGLSPGQGRDQRARCSCRSGGTRPARGRCQEPPRQHASGICGQRMGRPSATFLGWTKGGPHPSLLMRQLRT